MVHAHPKDHITVTWVDSGRRHCRQVKKEIVSSFGNPSQLIDAEPTRLVPRSSVVRDRAVQA
jgi:hypothetical protein